MQLIAVGPEANGKNRECSATGFLVNEEGYLLTNAHVVEEVARCLKGSPGAKLLARLAQQDATTAAAVSCDLAGLDEIHDLAVMKAERTLRPRGGESSRSAFVLLEVSELPVGTPVIVTGHPAFAWQPVTQAGKVVRRESLALFEKSPVESEALVVDIPLKQGNSGSPVYLEAGGVVGVIERRDSLRPSQSVAVPIRYAIELLDRYGVKWSASRK